MAFDSSHQSFFSRTSVNIFPAAATIVVLLLLSCSFLLMMHIEPALAMRSVPAAAAAAAAMSSASSSLQDDHGSHLEELLFLLDPISRLNADMIVQNSWVNNGDIASVGRRRLSTESISTDQSREVFHEKSKDNFLPSSRGDNTDDINPSSNDPNDNNIGGATGGGTGGDLGRMVFTKGGGHGGDRSMMPAYNHSADQLDVQSLSSPDDGCNPAQSWQSSDPQSQHPSTNNGGGGGGDDNPFGGGGGQEGGGGDGGSGSGGICIGICIGSSNGSGGGGGGGGGGGDAPP